MASPYVEKESNIVAMCKALDDCPNLNSVLARARCYMKHNIDNWAADVEAARRQKIRRDLIIVSKENAK
jgi:hypothetical protein